MKKNFRATQSRLYDLSEGIPKGHSAKRLNTLSGLVSGIIHKGSSHLVDISSGIPQNIDANSKTQAAKRFLSNKWTDINVHFLPFLHAF